LAVVPMLNRSSLSVAFAVGFGVSWLVLGAAGMHAMHVDPADPALKSSAESGDITEQFRPYCNVCRVRVRTDSKHCWECNKCVGNFDHHCPWLNNCVGEQNYNSFFVAIWALLAMLTTLLGAAIVPVLRQDNVDPADHQVGLAVLLLAVYGPLWCLDLSLVSFHCFLCIKGITTYEHLTGKTKRPAPAKKVEQSQAPNIDRSMSAHSFTSSAHERLPRQVSDFMFGSSEPADPADPASTRATRSTSRGSKKCTLEKTGSPKMGGGSSGTATPAVAGAVAPPPAGAAVMPTEEQPSKVDA